MMSLLAQVDLGEFVRPHIDWHAVAPELILLGVGALVTLIDIIFLDKARRFSSSLAALIFSVFSTNAIFSLVSRSVWL